MWCTDILEGGLCGCVGDGGGHMCGHGLGWGEACRLGRAGFGGKAPHVFLEWAVVAEGIVSLGQQLSVRAVEARWLTVAFEGGVEAAAVFRRVFRLSVAGDAADPAPFVFGGAVALSCRVGEHVAPLALAVLDVRLRLRDFAGFRKHVAGGAQSPVNTTCSVEQCKGEGRLHFTGVKEGRLYPVGLVEHLPLVEVDVVVELMEEFVTRREGPIGMAEDGHPVDDQLGVPMVGYELVDWGEVFEEGGAVVMDDGGSGFTCKG